MKEQLNRSIRRMSNQVRFLNLSLGSAKKCPICGWACREFRKVEYPYKPAISLVCPSCRSYERHRFAYLVLKNKIADYARETLHIAPERCIKPWLQSNSGIYLSVDLLSKFAMVHMDITDLGFDDNSFSLVWCSHVLEHIENDRQAMSEVYRVLKPDGLAVIQVPIYGQKTYEDSAIQSPEERLKHFYQDDHVRLCGLDIVQRLQNVGFKVNVIELSKLRDNHISKYGLDEPSTREIFLCSKH